MDSLTKHSKVELETDRHGRDEVADSRDEQQIVDERLLRVQSPHAICDDGMSERKAYALYNSFDKEPSLTTSNVTSVKARWQARIDDTYNCKASA